MAYNKHATIPYYSKKGVANDEARYAPPYLFDAAKVQTILQTTKFCSKKRMCADKKSRHSSTRVAAC